MVAQSLSDCRPSTVMSPYPPICASSSSTCWCWSPWAQPAGAGGLLDAALLEGALLGVDGPTVGDGAGGLDVAGELDVADDAGPGDALPSDVTTGDAESSW